MTQILLATLFAAYICHVNGQSSCRTPSGGIGTCKSIYHCEAFLDIVNKNNTSPDELYLLEKSQCGTQGTAPTLCCPETCYTPDNQPGRCVSIFACPHLFRMLRLPVSQEIMQYLQYSRCLDSKQFSVCCGPPPNVSLEPNIATPAIPLMLFTTSTQSPGPLSDPPLITNFGPPVAKPEITSPVATSTLGPTSPSPTGPPSTSNMKDEMVENVVVGSSCLTPDGEAGTCKSIYQCPTLLGLVIKNDRSPEATDLLQKTQCGFFGGNPAVCCSDLCYTPEGQPGKCMNINSCTHLANMLIEPVPKEMIQYVQNSRCQSSDKYSVCCGPPPDLSPPSKGNCAATVSAFPPDPRTECCGVDRRVNNEPVAPGITRIDQYPWLAVIEYTTIKNNGTKRLCIGALISGKYVMTAGHCLKGSVLMVGTPRNVRLGEFNTTNEGPDCVILKSGEQVCTEGAIAILIEQTITHPDYRPESNTRRNDIGLIRMLKAAPFTDFIRPICLPQEDITVSTPLNLNFYAAGWGYANKQNNNSELKLHVDLPYVSLKNCQPSYAIPRRRITLWHKQICAGGVLGKDTCKGDSGAPLMYQNGNNFQIVGLTSFGPTPCGIGAPGVYTKIYEYITWIRRIIRP